MATLNFPYKYGFHKPENYVFKSKKGLDAGVVRDISWHKKEPDWMRDFRLRALGFFEKKPLPLWGGDLTKINFNDIYYYIKPTQGKVSSWSDLPPEIKDTYDKIGIPEAEKKFLAGVSAQYECLSGDSFVFGDLGATQIKNLRVGDFIYALNEKTKKFERQKVLGILRKGNRPVSMISVAGRSIRCTLNHPFYVLRYTKEKGKRRGNFYCSWEYAKNLSKGDYIAISKHIPTNGQPYKLPAVSLKKTYKGKNQFTSFSVKADWLFTRNQKNLRLPSETSNALLWLIGLYIGDGYISRLSKNGAEVLNFAIPSQESVLRKRLMRAVKATFGMTFKNQNDPNRIRLFSRPIIDLFTALGLRGTAKTKKLPDWIFGLPQSQKLAFIAGHIDSDGYVRHGKKNFDVWITSVNKNLIEKVSVLGVSCGLHITGVHNFRYTIYSKNTIATGYRLQITGDISPLRPFSYKVSKNFHPRAYYHTFGSHHKSPIDKWMSKDFGFAPIRSIIPSGSEEVYDIEVNGHHNFIANGIIVHNSEVVYKSINQMLSKKGVIFLDMDSGLREYPEIVRKYFGTVIPPMDNKFAALNSSVWSGGSFVYVPKGVHVELPLQAYFRINAANMGQFERTLIIAEEGSYVHYVEGCTAPVYSTDSLHAAVVEIIVKRGARVRYTTIQNWSSNVYNLVTKRSRVEEEGTMEWVDGNLGCLTGDTSIVKDGDASRLEDVKVGDMVLSITSDFKMISSRVLAKKKNLTQRTYKIVTEDFHEIIATKNHPFLVLQKHGKIQSLSWKNLSEIRSGDSIAVTGNLPWIGKPYVLSFHPSRGVKKFHFPKESNGDLLWFLGFYIGDGYMDKTRVYIAAPATDKSCTRIKAIIEHQFGLIADQRGVVLRYNSTKFVDFLHQLGFTGKAKTKKIPQWIFSLPKSQISAFIEGYIAADGYFRANHKNISITSVNKNLLLQVKQLAYLTNFSPRKISKWVRREKKPLGKEMKEYKHYFLYFGDKKKHEVVQFTKVNSILYAGRKITYDIEVESGNFFANGIIVHNSKLTMKYPSIYLMGPKARGEVLSIAYAGPGQHQDAGGKAIHVAPETSSQIISKSISRGGGRTSYRGLVQVNPGATNVKSKVVCDALILDEASRSDTYPTMKIDGKDVTIEHEATVSKIGDEQLFYLESRGISKNEAQSMIVNGFIEPIVKELPLEYAVEMNRLIQLQMEGSVG